MTAHIYHAHIAQEPNILIACYAHGEGEGAYALLDIGEATFFPSVDQLRRLREQIDAYLAAHAPPAQAVDTNLPTCDLCLVALTGDNIGQSSYDPIAEEGTMLCQGCTEQATRQHAQDRSGRIGEGGLVDLPPELDNAVWVAADAAYRRMQTLNSLPTDLREGPYTSAPDGATYLHLPTGKRYGRKGGRWVLEMPF